jgi:ribosomal protein S18 acetylase RimI-like enzyme
LSLTELALRAYPGGRILRAVSGVRVATAADIAACYAISRDLPSDRPTSLDRDLREPERLLLVAEQNDAVIGYGRAALWTVVPDDGRDGYYLTGVSVHPDQRRRGVALALTQARMRWIARRAEEAWYFTNAANVASIALHSGFGFQEVTRAPSFRGVQFDGGEGILYRAPVSPL